MNCGKVNLQFKINVKNRFQETKCYLVRKALKEKLYRVMGLPNNPIKHKNDQPGQHDHFEKKYGQKTLFKLKFQLIVCDSLD